MSLGLSNTILTSKYYQYRSIKGMNFDGTDDSAFNDSNPGINLFASHTLSAWFRTTDVTTNQCIVTYADNGSRRCGIGIDANNGVESSYYSGSAYSGVANTSVISNDTWYHVVATHTIAGEDTSKQLYLDGVLQTGSYSQVIGLGYNKVVVGAKDSNGGDGMLGDIDEVAIWNKVLTANQVAGLYNEGRPRNAKSTAPDNLQFYFRMGEGDATGSGNVINHGIVDFDLTMHSNMASGDITTDVPG